MTETISEMKAGIWQLSNMSGERKPVIIGNESAA